jgi:hypothetical protein
MADTIKILAQSAPSATTSTDFYTVPASTSTVVSSITICNRDTVPVTFRLSVAIAGAGLANAQYIYYDAAIPVGQTYASTLGITLAATDKVRIYASTANLTFNLFGVEVT